MIRFEDLVAKAQAYMPDSDIELLRRAYVFSALAHKGQVRRSGQPYLVHPLEVAYFLADLRLEDDHDDDQDDGPEVLEDPASDEKAGPAGQGIKDAQGQEGDQDPQGPGSLDPYVKPVEYKGDEEDIDDILPTDAEEGFFQELNIRTSPSGLSFVILV